MKDLVCEGACNHGLVQQFDAALKQAGIGGVGWDWIVRARTFVHTPHVYVREFFYRCERCGTERQYGCAAVPAAPVFGRKALA